MMTTKTVMILLIAMVVTVGTGGYVAAHYVHEYRFHKALDAIPITAPNMSLTSNKKYKPGENPLLTAGMAEVNRWFPSFCFAEIYPRPHAFLSATHKLDEESCIAQVISNIKSETRIELKTSDVVSVEVRNHFKEIYGS